MGVLTDVESEGNSCRQDDSTDKLDENDELHAEAESTAEISYEYQFHEVVHSRVNPTTTLREKDLESIRHSSLANGLGNEDLLALGESLQHKRGQVSVLTQE